MSPSSNGNHPAGESRAPGNKESCNRSSVSRVGLDERDRRPSLLSTNGSTPARSGSNRVLHPRRRHPHSPNRSLAPRRKYKGVRPAFVTPGSSRLVPESTLMLGTEPGQSPGMSSNTREAPLSG